ncbi:MAG: hypothetical protein MZV64_63730 [Ignavibacteriales bacterium]|nr:hypothetical protein [Ignavibacteriales bacterium]
MAMSSRASKTLASGPIVQAVWPFSSRMSLTVIMGVSPSDRLSAGFPCRRGLYIAEPRRVVNRNTRSGRPG